MAALMVDKSLELQTRLRVSIGRRTGLCSRRCLLFAAALIVSAIPVFTQAPTQPPGSDRPAISAAQAEEWMTTLSNWGKWGPDDQLGALNYITPQKRVQAAALVRTGTVVSLERPVTLRERHDDIEDGVAVRDVVARPDRVVAERLSLLRELAEDARVGRAVRVRRAAVDAKGRSDRGALSGGAWSG